MGQARLTALAFAAAPLGFLHVAPATAASAVAPPEPSQVRHIDPQEFIGTWRDRQNRPWFTLERIDGNEIRAARFRLASLKSGHVDGDALTLTSRACVPVIGCYEYVYVGRMIGDARMDVTGYSEPCRFAQACREKGVEVKSILVRERRATAAAE